MSSLGVYAGTTASGVRTFEDWLGKPVDFIAVHTDRVDWANWQNSILSGIQNFGGESAELAWTIPMFSDQGTLAGAAAGDYDAYFVKAAKTMLAGRPGDSAIYVRIGEEFNLSTWPWAAKGHEQEFIQAYRHFVDAFRSVSSKFKFEWNVNLGDFGMDPATAYPGDAYVDIVGMDFYYKLKWDSADPLTAWNTKVSQKYGLQWVEDFAKSHGKPTAYNEWGVDSDTAGPYVQKAKEWFDSHNVLYESLWDANQGGFNGEIDSGQYPNVAQAYRAAELTQTVTLASGAASYALIGSYNDTLVGNGLTNVLTGNVGGNVIKGGAGADTLWGLAGDDSLDGGTGADALNGGAGNDTYWIDNIGDKVNEVAGAGTDTAMSWVSYTLPSNVENLQGLGSGALWIKGNELANQIVGNAAANTIYGMDGADTISGGGGSDRIIGGAGKDVMAGGDGADTFVFSAVTDSSKTAWDVITDLQNTDRIDLSAIDANPGLAGDQAFHLVGAFTKHAGEMTLKYNGVNATYLNLDLNGDGGVDMVLGLTGSHADFTNFIW